MSRPRVRGWARLAALHDAGLARAVVTSLLARIVAALGGLVLLVVVGRSYGAAGVGVLALAQGLALAAASLAAGGAPNALVRFVGRDPHSPLAGVYLRRAVLRALPWTVAAAGALLLTRDAIATRFDAPALAHVLPGFALAIPAIALALVASGVLKALRRPGIATLAENGALPLLAALAVAAAVSIRGSSIEALGPAYALAAFMVLALAGARTLALLPRGPARGRADRSDFDRSSRAFLVLGLTGLAQTSGIVLLLGLVLETEALGQFRAATQLAALVSIPPIALGAVFPPRYAARHHAGDRAGLERSASLGVLLSVATAGPIAACVLLFPEQVLGILGAEFRGAEDLLRILAAGHFANAALNLVGYVLTGCGHEAAARNIRVLTTVTGLVALVPASRWFGAAGAAWVVATMLAGQNLLFVYATWRTAGVWSLPGPNLLARLGIRGGRVGSEP